MKKINLLLVLCCFFVLCISGCKKEDNRYVDEKLWAFQEINEEHEYDTFFLGPACTTGKLEAPMLDLNNEVHVSKFTGAVKMNKGIYDENTRFFAPIYREALLCVYTLSADEKEPYLEEAYKDVKEAFEYYLENLNNGNKIILAGFSEGADMCLRLLKDYIGNNKFYKKFVCCYAIGTSVTDEYLNSHKRLKFTEGETDLKVIISFNTEDPNTTSTLFVGENDYSYSINPLTWSRSNEVADKSLNKGAVFLNSYGEVVNTVKEFTGCYIDKDRGTLKVTDVVKDDYNSMKDLMGDGSFHLYDYQFFFENLRENVNKRIENNLD